MKENDEILDIVDVQDQIVGSIRRGDMVDMGYRSPKGYVRFAVGFLVNADGHIWTPTRGMHKSISPGGLDFSVAEHVLSGETYAVAIRRAFDEEAGITVDLAKLKLLGKLPPTRDKPSYEAVYSYASHTTGDPNYSREEFTGGRWVAPMELERLLASGVPAKTTLLPALHLFLDS